MAQKLYDITCNIGTYQGADGQTKYRSIRVGTVWQGKNGPYMRLDRHFNPAGVPVNDPATDNIICNMWEPRAGDNGQAPDAAQRRATPANAAHSTGAPAFDDDIPF
jgi:hypothetical protein